MNIRLCEVPFSNQLQEVSTHAALVSVLPIVEESEYQTVLLDDGIEQVYAHVPKELVTQDKLLNFINRGVDLSGFVFLIPEQNDAQLFVYEMTVDTCETF